mmetsp:Transcript_46519/g.108134  ORF Transcript_46519/g.108134 Transcript_46519/m.108134 type:complete len:560 (-) Transcript_46519:308-1987(-)
MDPADSSAIERAERTAAAREKALKYMSTPRAKALKYLSSPQVHTPPPSSHESLTQGVYIHLCKCLSSTKVAAPAPSKEDTSMGIATTECLMHTFSSEVLRRRSEVLDSRAAVESAFRAIAAHDAVQDSTRLGHSADRSARTKMWEMLDSQVVSGFGGPTEQQLTALWEKYDRNHDGHLSKRELQNILCDHAGGMAKSLEAQLPRMRKLVRAQGTGNPFLGLAIKSFVSCSEAQLMLCKAHAEGNISNHEVEVVFSQLDVDGDGSVTRDEFFRRAQSVFFAVLLQAMSNFSSIHEIGMPQDDGDNNAGGENKAPSSVLSPAIEKAEREAKQARGDIDAAKARLEAHRRRVERELRQGSQAMLASREELRDKLREEVSKSAATTLVRFEMAVGDDAQLEARQQMWGLLSKQLIAGLGPPRPTQLEALWKAYDTDGSNSMSKGELWRLMMDYARSRAVEIERDEIPSLTKELEANQGNHFFTLIGKARLLTKQAQAALFRSQADGAISDADLRAAFEKLDTNADGTIGVKEFLAGATDAFFEIQLLRLQRMRDFHAAAEANS